MSQWTTDDVADHLGVTRSTVHRYTTIRHLPEPAGYVGRTPWWDSGEIKAWAEARPSAYAKRIRETKQRQKIKKN